MKRLLRCRGCHRYFLEKHIAHSHSLCMLWERGGPTCFEMFRGWYNELVDADSAKVPMVEEWMRLIGPLQSQDDTQKLRVHSPEEMQVYDDWRQEHGLPPLKMNPDSADFGLIERPTNARLTAYDPQHLELWGYVDVPKYPRLQMVERFFSDSEGCTTFLELTSEVSYSGLFGSPDGRDYFLKVVPVIRTPVNQGITFKGRFLSLTEFFDRELDIKSFFRDSPPQPK